MIEITDRVRYTTGYTKSFAGGEVLTGERGTVVDVEERGDRDALVTVLWDDGARSTVAEFNLVKAR